MKFKKIILVLIMAFCFVCSFSLVACEAFIPHEEAVTLKAFYMSTEGGHIDGKTNQLVKKGGDAQTVVAVPDEDYVFVKWSEDNYESSRTDKNVIHDVNVTAIFEKENYVIEYKADKGGYIQGAATQNLDKGEWGEPVRAIPDEEFAFVKWSDGYNVPIRSDKIFEKTELTAYFEKVATKFEYNYNHATENRDDSSVIIKYDDINDIKLTVPSRPNSNFEGWYLDKEFTKQVSDENGNIVMDDKLFADEAHKLYAKFSNIENVTYKILMVYITDIDLYINDEFTTEPEFKCKYTMSDFERNVCIELSARFESYLNETFDGWVNFEVDNYFTTQTVHGEDFELNPRAGGSHMYLLKKVPEIDDSYYKNYRFMLTVIPTKMPSYIYMPNTWGGDVLQIFDRENFYDGATLYTSTFYHPLYGLLNPNEAKTLESLDWEKGTDYLLTVFVSSIDIQLYEITKGNHSNVSFNFYEGFMNKEKFTFKEIVAQYLTYDTLPDILPNDHDDIFIEGVPYSFWQMK